MLYHSVAFDLIFKSLSTDCKALQDLISTVHAHPSLSWDHVQLTAIYPTLDFHFIFGSVYSLDTEGLLQLCLVSLFLSLDLSFAGKDFPEFPTVS